MFNTMIMAIMLEIITGLWLHVTGGLEELFHSLLRDRNRLFLLLLPPFPAHFRRSVTALTSTGILRCLQILVWDSLFS